MNYKKFVAPNSFIEKYLQVRSKSCAPLEFEFWCALWVLGQLNSRVRVCNHSVVISVQLLCSNGMSNINECILYAQQLGDSSTTLKHSSPDAFTTAMAAYWIPVFNETRRSGDLLAEFERIDVAKQSQFTMTVLPDAHDVLNRWNHARSASHNKMQAAFESVEHLHLVKVAALLALNDSQCAVNGTHMYNAIKLIRHVKKSTFDALSYGYAKDKAALALEKITEILRTRQLEPLKSRDLYLSVRQWIDVDTFHFCMDIMHELKFVTKFASSGTGRKIICYKATDALLNDNVVRQVLKEVDLK